ncbi:MAG: hypothetical protein QXI15_04730, partial [Zestosphaera sp.]
IFLRFLMRTGLGCLSTLWRIMNKKVRLVDDRLRALLTLYTEDKFREVVVAHTHQCGCFGFSGYGFIPPVYPRSPRLRLQVVAGVPRVIGEERFTEPRPSPTTHQLTGSEMF